MLILNPVDRLLNSITMYRVVLYGLTILCILSFVLSFMGIVSFTPLQLFESILILLASCYITNTILSALLKVPPNVESVYITAFILFFVLSPTTNTGEIITLVMAGAIAMASKYLLAIRKKHLFNPAALAAVALGLFGNGMAIWWVATPLLTIATAIIGLLIVRKIRRFALFISFLIAALIMIFAFGAIQHQDFQSLFMQVLVSWPIIFFGTVMLTEPLTTPPTKQLQILYGALVGLLFGSQFHVGPLYSTPELALVLGNIFSYIVSPKQRLVLTLKEKKEIGHELYEFAFTPDQKMPFRPGQYLEWTIPQKKSDSRGNRRYFTIASSPTESEIKLGIKVPREKSSFKNELTDYHKGDLLFASQLAGDFTLPEDATKKLVFVAGGIGITPFRSMIQYLVDQKEKRDIVLFYLCADPAEFAYKDIFTKGEQYGVKTVYVITKAENAPKGWHGETGRLSSEVITKHVPDCEFRIFYLSGPNAMVEAYGHLLGSMKVPNSNIIKDYFPGF